MQRRVPDDLAVHESQQRQVAAQVNVLAPIADDLRLGDTVFDKHALTFGHGQEELVEVLLIVLAQRAQLALGTDPSG